MTWCICIYRIEAQRGKDKRREADWWIINQLIYVWSTSVCLFLIPMPILIGHLPFNFAHPGVHYFWLAREAPPDRDALAPSIYPMRKTPKICTRFDRWLTCLPAVALGDWSIWKACCLPAGWLIPQNEREADYRAETRKEEERGREEKLRPHDGSALFCYYCQINSIILVNTFCTSTSMIDIYNLASLSSTAPPARLSFLVYKIPIILLPRCLLASPFLVRCTSVCIRAFVAFLFLLALAFPFLSFRLFFFFFFFFF